VVTIKRDRYVAFQIISDKEIIEESVIKSSIWNFYQRIYGLFGSSGSGLYFEEYDEKKKTGIIRCVHTSLPQLLTILAVLSEINDSKVLIQILNVSGTVNKAKQMIITNNFKLES
jgi:RNase P/RNase MRP subunit POP5